jgi:amino acid transporter
MIATVVPRQSILMDADSTLPPPVHPPPVASPAPSVTVEPLHRHFGLLHATALNVTMIVGAGVFATIPFMLKELPGPYALLGWLAGGALMLMDGLIWSELGAALPGSGGSYLYLLECYGRERWGRLMAFLFIWQFLFSGPLEIASGLIAAAQFANALDPRFEEFNKQWTWDAKWQDADLAVAFGPGRIAAVLAGVVLLVLLYRRITALGRLTVTFWLGVLAVSAWILVEGVVHFDSSVALDFSGAAAETPDLRWNLGTVMVLAMYSYLGYYNICYIGGEVRDAGRTIPRSILLSAVLVCLLFVALHLAMLGTVPWPSVDVENPGSYNLAAEFMKRIHDSWAGPWVSVLLIWSCLGSAFAGLLGYSRIPYGAACYGHFFSTLGRVHPRLRIPHVSLLLVGGLTLFWCFFDLESVIKALFASRILGQFVPQIIGLVLLRYRRPDLPRPFRIWFYPVPCGLALAGWLYMFGSMEWPFLVLGGATLALGAAVFRVWSRASR